MLHDAIVGSSSVEVRTFVLYKVTHIDTTRESLVSFRRRLCSLCRGYANLSSPSSRVGHIILPCNLLGVRAKYDVHQHAISVYAYERLTSDLLKSLT